jgi:hypothetical protein
MVQAALFDLHVLVLRNGDQYCVADNPVEIGANMVPPSKVSGYVQPVMVSQNSIEALERLRDSYNGLLAWESRTEADRAVLAAVGIALKQIKKAQQLA